jgi:hypothetical protein
MTAITAEPFFAGSTGRNTRGLLRITILCLIAAAAVASRLFSVIRTYTSSQSEIFHYSLPTAAICISILDRRCIMLSLLVLLLTSNHRF